MAEERRTVSTYLNVFGYTTVLCRLFYKGDSRIINARKGWGVNSFRQKMYRENRTRKNLITPIPHKVVHCPIKSRRLGKGEGRFLSILVISLGNLCIGYMFQTGTVCFTKYYLAMPLKVPVFFGSFFRKFCLAFKFV